LRSKALCLLAVASLPIVALADDAAPEAQLAKKWGTYTPNFGFKLVDTDKGDMSISIYTYVRYLNQKMLDSTYTDAFGNEKTVQERQDFQLQKVQIKFLGWLLDPKFRYFLYAWTANTSQGLGAQVVLAGNLNYTFNEHLTLSGGITSLPGTRSVEGNFPFWLAVDARLIADEFFRPSYTSGVWAKGQITDTLRYQVMLGNNMSTLGVSAAQLDNKIDTLAGGLIWEQKDFGLRFGDFEGHERPTSRLGIHYTQSTEDKQSQPSTDDFENTQIRLSDGSVVFTPDLFGPGTTVEQVFDQMVSVDGAVKYRGCALEAEYFFRRLSDFQGPGTAGLPRRSDRGFQVQASAMLMPKKLQIYLGGSRIDGEFGKPWDTRLGANWFPFENKVVRWNTEFLYLHKSPVGGTAYPFAVGGNGLVFHTNVELAL
jgi:hypothetical protein